MRQHDAGTLSRMLAERIGVLARELLPNGRKDGAEWRCGSLAGEKGQSLAVHLNGSRAGIWADFSSGERGDALDLVAAVLFAGDRREAMKWAVSWLGLGDGSTSAFRAPERRQVATDRGREDLDQEAQRKRASARKLWHDTPAGIAGTPVEAYLAGRGIVLRELGRAPGALRFNPSLWCAEVQRPLPAMIAAICGSSGKLVAVHRTWLSEMPGGGWVKADLQNAKKVLGSFAGGCVRLWRGASGKALGVAPEGDMTVIAEGIETALSVAVACPEFQVLSAVSLSNMAAVALPDTLKDIIIAADNDSGNEKARRALEAALKKFASQGRTVRLAMPEIVHGDWNDVLRGKDTDGKPERPV
ncbi:DUF7146 domain-containing protein [Gluconobacter oxydans]|nr:toprim domain-containing protein [Gluconobacter oxydans]TCW27474.1 Toprim domain-containing protein [Gluconobacter oxydans]GEC61895.1 DNA primase [Gluconobacter oxydans]